MGKPSVRLRITAWYTLAVVVMLALFLSISHQLLQQNILTSSQKRVENAVETVAQKMTQRLEDMLQKGYLEPGVQRAPKTFQYHQKGVHTALYGQAYALLSTEHPFSVALEVPFTDGGHVRLTLEGEPYYLYDRSLQLSDGSVYWIRGVLPMTGEETALAAAERYMLLLGGVIVMLAALGGWLLLGRVLRPVRHMSHTAREIAESGDLSRRVGVRGTDELAQLAEVLDGMLDKVSDAFEKEKQFTADASHELRTPITVILSECEFLEGENLTEAERETSLQTVRRQSERMYALVNSLLLLSRMDSGNLRPETEQTDLTELTEFICREQQRLRGGSITLTTDLEPGIFGRVDRLLYTRLLDNLMVNAYRYNRPDGSIHVSLRLQQDSICLQVADTGIGIDKAELNHIWNRFYRADPARKKDSIGGTGLGLPMVQWITHSHGGTVAVDSTPGKGSVFTVVIPQGGES